MRPDKGRDPSQVAVQNLFPISPETLNNLSDPYGIPD